MIQNVFKHKRKNKNGKTVSSRLYYGRYRIDEEFAIKTIPLKTSDKQVAEKRLSEIVKNIQLENAGILPQKGIADAARKPLTAHLSDCIANLQVNGRSEKYIYNINKRNLKLFKECGWSVIKDINPDKLVEWRSKQKDKAAKTLNEYTDSICAFLNWMVAVRRIEINPLSHIKKISTVGKEVRVRRAFSDEEMRRLLAVAENRRAAYLTAVNTGLRRAELKALEWRDVDLDGPKPRILLPPTKAKNKRAGFLPLSTEVVAVLRLHKAEEGMEDGLVFKGALLPDMRRFKRDLELAGIEYKKEGRVCDFHSFRHTLATNLAKSNQPLRVAMEMMRHSDARLTMKTYTDAYALPLEQVPAALPSFLDREESTQRSTQTPDVTSPPLSVSDPIGEKSEDLQIAQQQELWHGKTLIDAISPEDEPESLTRGTGSPCTTLNEIRLESRPFVSA